MPWICFFNLLPSIKQIDHTTIRPYDQTTRGYLVIFHVLREVRIELINKTMFERHVGPAAPKPKYKLHKPHKTRSDKKYDIKVKLSPGDKKILGLRMIDNAPSLTEFCSNIVKGYLSQDMNYGDYDYDENGVFVHVLLEKELHNKIKSLKVEWGMSSYRRVAHRILKEYLHRNCSTGVEISHWRDK